MKTRKTTNIVLAILGIFLAAFILAMIVIFCVYGSVPDTLIQCVLGTGGVEAFVLAAIKICKVITENKNNSNESEDIDNG